MRFTLIKRYEEVGFTSFVGRVIAARLLFLYRDMIVRPKKCKSCGKTKVLPNNKQCHECLAKNWLPRGCAVCGNELPDKDIDGRKYKKLLCPKCRVERRERANRGGDK